MGKFIQNVTVLTLTGDDNSAIAGAVTKYLSISGNFSVEDTEADVQTRLLSGVLKNIRLRAKANTSGGATLTLRVGGADSALTISVPNNDGAKTYTGTGEISIANGDLVDYKIATVAGGSITITAIQADYVQYNYVQ